MDFSLPSSGPPSTPSTSNNPIFCSSAISGINIVSDSVQDIDEVALQHIDSPDFVEPGLERAANDENFGDLEINLLADPASWCPFPSQSQILRQNGKTIGFRTKSGIMFGPKRIEIMADTLANNGCVQIYCP